MAIVASSSYYLGTRKVTPSPRTIRCLSMRQESRLSHATNLRAVSNYAASEFKHAFSALATTGVLAYS